MHSSVGSDDPANWLTSQRLANWSYNSTGSPSALTSQTPPKPLQIVAMPTGPYTDAPVPLLNTWNAWFTVWAYWVRPTSPLVSGGAQLQVTPGNAAPSKFSSGDGMLGVAAV